MWPRAALTVALRGPGRALLVASAAGWIALAWLANVDWPHPAVAIGHDDRHAAVSTAALTSSPSGHFIAMWLAMMLAMAPPLLLREIGRLWRTSLHRSRHLVVAAFLSGYVAIWLLAGVVFGMLAGWLAVSVDRIIFAVACAVVWHGSPARQRCLNACHRVPTLRVFGVPAQWDAVCYGVATACYCVAACGLAMPLVLLAGNAHLAAMAVVAVIATPERYSPARRPCWRLPLLRDRSADWPPMPATFASRATSRP